MKWKSTLFIKLFSLTLISAILIISNVSYGQSPLKYGNDIIVNNQPTENQHSPGLSVAFNGWIFASYIHENTLVVRKSIDDGATWTNFLLYNNISVGDIVVCGTSVADLKLFVAGYNTISQGLFVDRYDAVTAAFSGAALNTTVAAIQVTDLKIASDYKFPAAGASPYTLALAFSLRSSYDSVICWTSPDGGNSFPAANRKLVEYTNKFFNKVSVSYGRSLDYPSGIYFVAYEQSMTGDKIGHIKLSHSDFFFNGVFVSPIYIDSTYSFDGDHCRNPVVSCQSDNISNSVNGLTVFVAYDRIYSATDWDVKYSHSLNSVSFPVTWTRDNITTGASKEIQSDVSYDPVYHNFLVTYYDSINQKLPYLVKDVNLTNPDIWVPLSTGYNDSPSLIAPYPRVQINPAVTQVAFLWAKDGSPSGNGVIMYDAEYSTAGICEKISGNLDCSIYPNPASDKVNININETGSYIVSLTNLVGQEVLNQTIESGNSNISVSNYAKGIYLLKISKEGSESIKKIIIQ